MFTVPLLFALSMPALAAPTRGGGTERGGGERNPPTETTPPEQPKPKEGEGQRKPADEGKKGKKKNGKKKKKKSGFKIDRVNPFYGTLVYGPKPKSHKKYQDAKSKKRPTNVDKKDMPERKVDRKQTMAFGVRGGGLFYSVAGEPVNEGGAGGIFRWRPFEAVGIQLDLSHHADHFPGAEHANTLFGASGEIFLFPWKAVSPYLGVGAVQNVRGGGGVSNVSSVLGASGALGLQLGIGGSAAFELEGKLIGWTNLDPSDTTSPTAGQLNGGLVLHF